MLQTADNSPVSPALFGLLPKKPITAQPPGLAKRLGHHKAREEVLGLVTMSKEAGYGQAGTPVI